MGTRKAGAANVHTDRDQVTQIEGAVPHGDTLKMLPAELNVSGGLPLNQRPTLLAAVEGVERGEYAGIIVGYLSRLGRNLKEQLLVYDRVHAAGGRIIVAQEGIDARTRGGRLQRNILAAIHEDEREAHVERFDHLRQVATAAGIWQSRVIPSGYIKDPGTRRLKPGPDAPQVRRAFADAAAGTALSQIAGNLGMTTSGVRHMLKNRVYLGEIHRGEYVNDAAHPPLVTLEQWEAAQSRRVRPPRSGDFDGPALLAGLVRCEACGHTMNRTSAKVVVYRCHGRSSAGRCPSPAAVTANLLDRHVVEIVLTHVASITVDMAENDRRVQDLREAAAAARLELTTYIESVSAADVGQEAFAAGARVRSQAASAADRALELELQRRPALGLLADGLDAWEKADQHQRNAYLRGLLEVVVVRRGGGRGSRTPLADRVRLLRLGSVEVPRKNGSDPLGITGLPFPAADDDRVIGMLGA